MKRYFLGLAARLGTIPEAASRGFAQDRGHSNFQGVPVPTPTIRRDTGAWRLQVWVSFAISVMLCGSGLAWLPGQDLDRAFMVMGYVFCLSTAFALAKFIRDNQDRSVDTPMWRISGTEATRHTLIESLPIPRVAQPEEIAWAYIYLASDEAAFVTGQSISPNGGDVMW